jgi:hypothetical protein
MTDIANSCLHTLHEFFSKNLAGKLSSSGVSLSFDFPSSEIDPSMFMDSNHTFNSDKAKEWMSRQKADKSAYLGAELPGLTSTLLPGPVRTRMADISIADTLRYKVCAPAEFAVDPSDPEERRAKSLARFSRNREEALLRFEQYRQVSKYGMGADYANTQCMPDNWLDPSSPISWSHFYDQLWSQDGWIDTSFEQFAAPVLYHLFSGVRFNKALGPWPIDNPRKLPPNIDPLGPDMLVKPLVGKSSLDRTSEHDFLASGGDADNSPVNLEGFQYFEDLDSKLKTDFSGIDLRELMKWAMVDNALAKFRGSSFEEMSIEFDFLMVDIARPWLFEPFYDDTNWFIPGMRRGDLTIGPGSERRAVLGRMPLRMIVVRDLVFKAAFSHSDIDYFKGATFFGPFALSRRSTISTSELRLPEMRILAYVDKKFGVMPPVDDPHLG